MPELFEPARLGPLTLKTRVIKAATFEGMTPGGQVSDQLIEFHRKVARGGAAMTTQAYVAVAPEGRTDDGGLYLHAGVMDGLRRLTDAVHAEGALISAQVGHAGPVANSRSNGVPSYAPGKFFNPLGMSRTKACTEYDIARITSDYERGAKMCVEAGFDCLEIHLGHNYLLSSFLSPALNRRKDRWGGSLENRARFARQVVKAVRGAVGDEVAVIAKLNMEDGYKGGLKIDDSLQVAKWLEEDGALDAIELTSGSSLMNPMYLFKGAAPLKEFVKTLPWYLRPGFRMVGKGFLKVYPYEEAYFLEKAKRFREALDMPLVLLGGIAQLETAERGLAEGFEFVAMGRALLIDPDLINKFEDGSRTKSRCIHCNRCMATIYTGTRCPLVDPKPGDRPMLPEEAIAVELSPTPAA
jgi:2,4-dienoyl-CoA reductase-like NADH-dependent reductase (Old Yellow Enzyme family)